MQHEPMTCPWCHGTELSEGVIVGRSPGVKFRSTNDALGDLAGIPLTGGFFNHSAAALRCRSCGTVIVPPPAA